MTLKFILIINENFFGVKKKYLFLNVYVMKYTNIFFIKEKSMENSKQTIANLINIYT